MPAFVLASAPAIERAQIMGHKYTPLADSTVSPQQCHSVVSAHSCATAAVKPALSG